MARVWGAMIVTALVVLTASAATAQQPEAKPAEKPKTLLEEIALFGYVEASYVGNLGHTSADSGGLTSSRQVNTLRLYDSDEGFIDSCLSNVLFSSVGGCHATTGESC